MPFCEVVDEDMFHAAAAAAADGRRQEGPQGGGVSDAISSEAQFHMLNRILVLSVNILCHGLTVCCVFVG
jgi:hypothetical protein